MSPADQLLEHMAGSVVAASGFWDPGQVGFLDQGRGCGGHFIILSHTFTFYVLFCVSAEGLEYLRADCFILPCAKGSGLTHMRDACLVDIVG